MDTKTIFVLTPKGEEEVAHKTSLLYGDIKRALSMIDGVSTYAEISKRAAPSLRTILAELIKELLTGGFIQDKARAAFAAKIVVPAKVAPAPPQAAKHDQSDSELDFTTIMRAPSADILRAEAAKVQAEQIAKQQAEQQRLKAEQDAARAKQIADAENLRKAQEAEIKAKEAEARARKEAEEKARKEAEEKARKEAEEKARKEAEEKARKEAEEKARKEAEEKARKEAEEKARKEAEEKARKEAEEKARKEAEEKARKEAEEKARKEAEEKARKEAEEKARKEAEEKARKEAEEKARKEAEEKARKEAEEKARREAEAKAKEDAERKARAQAEFARLKAEQEAEKARIESEAVKAREEAARIKQEAELAATKAKEEAERVRREAEAAAAQAKAEVERVRKEAELAASKAKEEAERIRQAAEAQAKALEEATRKAQQEADAARLQAEQEAARVRAELEAARVRVEQEELARAEAETARLAAQHIAAQALVAAEQKKLQELEQQAIQAREEEQIRAKQHALAAASTQVRDTPYDTSKPPAALKLDAIDLDALEIKPDPVVAQRHADPEKIEVVVPGPSAAELKAKEEALKQQAKKAEEARLAEEAAAKKLADAQAKAWAEAEQRATQAAKAHVEHLAQQSAQSAQAKQQQEKKIQAAMRKRKPLPWGGISAGLAVLAVAAVFVVPMLLPTRNYADALESQLSAKLKQPVHIGKMAVRILPTPRVELGEIYIGEVKQIKAQQAQLDFGFAALFGSVKRVEKMELQGAELNSSGLLTTPDWLQQMAADATYPISRIAFSGLKVGSDAVQFNDVEGTLDFSPEGKIAAAMLRAQGGKYALELKAASAGKYAAVFNLRKASLPLLPNWNFDELTAKGELSAEGLLLNEFDSRIAGGVLQGDAKLGWKNGWSVQGSLNAKSVSLSSLSKLMEGDMDGVARFKMQSDTLANLADSAALDGTLVAKKGLFNGVDIVETARLHSKEHLPGGRTHFDQLDSTLVYSANAYHFKSMKIVNSVMNASGGADISKQQLSGKFSARLSITEGMGPVDLQLGGATDNPTMRALR